jgi:hypothetical protein
MSSKTFINQLLDNSLQFIDNSLVKIWLLFKELLEGNLGFGCSTLADVIFQQEEIVSIQANNHLDSLRIVGLAVDVLNDLTGKLMHNQLLDLAGNFLSHEFLLFVKRCKEVQLRREVMSVLGGHHHNKVLLDFVSH